METPNKVDTLAVGDGDCFQLTEQAECVELVYRVWQ